MAQQQWILLLLLLTATADGAWISSSHKQQRPTTTTTRRGQSPSPTLNKVTSHAPTALFASKTDDATTTTTPLNPLLDSIQPSATVQLFSKVKQMQAEGMDVTSLCVGEPDYPPPPAVLDGVVQALEQGQTRYTAVTGTLELRQAIAADLKERCGVSYDPISEICVANGAKQCVYQGLLACVGVGDQVLVPAPHWTYPDMVKLCGAEPVTVMTKAENGYCLTGEQLRITLTANPKIKLLILCNPSNPTGGVYTKAALQDLVKVLEDFPEVRVLADEIYNQLVYSEDACPSFASLSPTMFERTLTVNGFSKSHAMTGFRLGYIAAPKYIAAALSKIQSQLTSCASSLAQAAGVAALTQVSPAELQANVENMREKRDYVLARLAEMPGVTVAMPPQGAFYVLPDISQVLSKSDDSLKDDVDFCNQLLERRKLAIVPGTGFGAPGTARISYATSMEELQLAMDKLQAFVEEIVSN